MLCSSFLRSISEYADFTATCSPFPYPCLRLLPPVNWLHSHTRRSYFAIHAPWHLPLLVKSRPPGILKIHYIESLRAAAKVRGHLIALDMSKARNAEKYPLGTQIPSYSPFPERRVNCCVGPQISWSSAVMSCCAARSPPACPLRSHREAGECEQDSFLSMTS